MTDNRLEAARTGEAEMGFAVVADEIKELVRQVNNVLIEQIKAQTWRR